MTSSTKSTFIDKLDDRVNKHNNTFYSTIKMKPIDVRSNKYIDSSKQINNKDPKPRIGDIVKILKHKNIFAKGYTPNCLNKFLWLKKLKTLCRGHMILMILMERKL